MKEIGDAIDLYVKFRERKPTRVKVVRVKNPKAVMVVGHVEEIVYRTTHGNKKLVTYKHPFQPGSRPLLCASSDGSRLLLLGGHYEFEARGIVDKDARGNKVYDPEHGSYLTRRQANPKTKIGQTVVKVSKGIYYFPNYQSAENYAKNNGYPTNRIISYQLGWAIQLKVSGDYVGPDTGRKSNPGKLRQKDVYAQIRALGLTVKKTEHGEHRVTFPTGPGVSAQRAEDMAHYTDDLADALGTAQHMARFPRRGQEPG